MSFDDLQTPFLSGVHKLSAAPLRALADAIPALYAEANPQNLPQVFTDTLARLIPGESHGVVVRDLRGDRAWHIQPASADHEARVPIFFQHFSEFAPAAYRRQTGSGEALALSDFVSPAQMERLAIYREYYRPIGLEDDLSINVTMEDVVICASTMRAKRGFGSDERELMNALRPHFKQAWTNAKAFTRASAKPTGRGWSPDAFEKCFGLTPREAEVLLWLAQGKTNPEIARILGIRPYTVRTHVERIFTKLGVNNRHAATLRVFEIPGL
jgi:DNA-binding CsgD family transcriptional regulator